MTIIQSKKRRIILHIDMNCFYASVERIYHPDLKNKPIAIAGNPEERKGIIVTSSYEARAKGVKTTMPLWQAMKLCPDLIVLRPNFDRYRSASEKLFKMMREITPYVQPVSIDEGYMDITNIQSDPLETAKLLQKRMLQTLDLPCSIGIGPNKFLAKMASDMKKPLGITVLRIRDLPQKMWQLPIEKMYGVGNKTAVKLHQINITTIGELAKGDVYQLSQLLGINGERLKNRANGIDSRPVDPEAVHDFKSVGSSQTLPFDTTDENEIRTQLDQLASKVEKRLQRRNAVGLTVQLMIRYSDRKTITRSKKLNEYIQEKTKILYVAMDLFYQHWNLEPIRLLGITVQDVAEKHKVTKQLDLFSFEKEIERDKLQLTIDQLTKKYGKNVFIPFKK
ncbi:DNA polymerase IV [Virgibacillus sp. W0181]|uniref:DNA polymerase IV n=1 Tax=Virgibacillus sp. W0181 TaxID=3391581 RepID=UPI003F469866